jgi:hypothetical protein
MGAVTLSQKLSDLSKFAIKLFGMFEALSWEKSNLAAIDTFGHQVRGDSLRGRFPSLSAPGADEQRHPTQDDRHKLHGVHKNGHGLTLQHRQ